MSQGLSLSPFFSRSNTTSQLNQVGEAKPHRTQFLQLGSHLEASVRANVRRKGGAQNFRNGGQRSTLKGPS